MRRYMDIKSKGRVVIVNGKPGVGKSTFEDICADILGVAYCEKRSTVDKVKELAKEAGWKGTKDLKDRKLLSDLKQIFTEYNDMPLNDVRQYLYGWEDNLAYYNVAIQPHVLFVDDREPEHIDKLKSKLNAVTLLIRRPGDNEIETSNSSDENVFDYWYDYTIDNNGDLDQLKEKAEEFLNWLFN